MTRDWALDPLRAGKVFKLKTKVSQLALRHCAHHPACSVEVLFCRNARHASSSRFQAFRVEGL